MTGALVNRCVLNCCMLGFSRCRQVLLWVTTSQTVLMPVSAPLNSRTLMPAQTSSWEGHTGHCAEEALDVVERCSWDLVGRRQDRDAGCLIPILRPSFVPVTITAIHQQIHWLVRQGRQLSLYQCNQHTDLILNPNWNSVVLASGGMFFRICRSSVARSCRSGSQPVTMAHALQVHENTQSIT